MKLYYEPGSSSFSIRVLLNELGKEVEYEAVDPKTKKTESGVDYYSITPKGVIPALELPSGDILTENPVIQQYLIDQFGPSSDLLKSSNSDRYEVISWLMFVASELHSRFHLINNPKFPLGEARDIIDSEIMSKFALCEKQLSKHEYLCGDHFTAADTLLFVMLYWGYRFEFDLDKFPHLSKYYLRIKSRPSVAKALEQEGIGPYIH
jgi:glutathione S-transferase